MNWLTVIINGKEVSVAFNENSIHIYNAFPIKDDLKLRGYRWNPKDKSWYIQPGDIGAEMAVLKNNLQTPDENIIEFNTQKNTNSNLGSFPDSYSVGELRHRLDQIIRKGIGGNIWLRGIIASEVKQYKWASYFDLKDEDDNQNMFFRAEVKTQQWGKIQRKLKDTGVANSLEKDLPVFCLVEVLLPFRNVIDIRLNLLDILPEFTQAKIRNQREITLDQLKKEGILENQKKLSLPDFISNIGLITSEQGTSIKDINAGLHPYENKYQFYFVDSRMEGTNSVDSIIHALECLETTPHLNLDAIIIARGGGSEQSLSIFNDLRLCRKVCMTQIPILTAIGHEKDISAIELCSWLTPTPSTPSGIGKYLQNRYFNLQDQLNVRITQLIHHFNNVHNQEMTKIRTFLKNIPTRVSSVFKLKEERFFTLIRSLERSIIFTVKDHERILLYLLNLLQKKSQDLIQKNNKDLCTIVENLLFRALSINQREFLQLKKSLFKLDFEKRLRENLKQRNDLNEKIASIISQSQKKINNSHKELQAAIKLIQANDPTEILKKGFTLTLDNNHRVIKSIKDFPMKEKALLKFHDGQTSIQKANE